MHIALPQSRTSSSPRAKGASGRGFANHILALFCALILALFSGAAFAHAFKTSGAAIYFDRQTETMAFALSLNLEAILANVDPDVTDTNDSPNAAEYDRLRLLPPAELQKLFEGFKQTLIDGVHFEFDGKRFEPEITDVHYREVGDVSLARDTTVTFRTKLPPEAEVFTFHWSPAFGKVTLRTTSPNARSLHIEVVERGGKSTPIVIDDVESRTRFEMILDFLKIGFEHIVPLGLDHILFVVGIFLLSIKARPILTQVTAFTIAHTVTLGLGTLGYVNIPREIVEPLIAASIVYVAVENILRPTLSPWRPAVVFCFGLLHGLGFAGFLKQFNIPEGQFIVGLLSFNVGVELGQLAVIAICYLAVGIWFGGKPWYRQRVVIPGSLIISAIGAYWFFERVFA